jgi:molybdenum cofactor cytidylyltransferase
MRGRNKLLARIQGKPMIRRVVEAALKSKVDEVIVVVGWQADRIRKALVDTPCRFVMNKDYRKGQSASLKAALRDVGETTQAILVLPGDVAMIDARSINLVIDDYSRLKHLIAVAAYKGKQGHPILLDRQLFNEIATINEQTYGLKAVTERNRKTMRLVETGSSSVLRDVDTPEELKKITGKDKRLKKPKR